MRFFHDHSSLEGRCGGEWRKRKIYLKAGREDVEKKKKKNNKKNAILPTHTFA